MLRDRILNASYYAPEHYEHPRLGLAYRKWVESIFDFYTAPRLRRSSSHPASSRSVRRILRVLGGQRDGDGDSDGNDNDNDDSVSEAIEPPTIRILVMGGSVTLGNNCLANSEVPGLPVQRRAVDYAWPSRLEYMLNGVFLPRDKNNNGNEEDESFAQPRRNKLFQIYNVAMGATNSEMGASMLENHLVAGLDDDANSPPHIVIASYSTNDSRDPDLNVTFHSYQQSWVQAAFQLWPCDDDLPLVALADDVHGALEEPASLEVTGSLYKVASWYDVMMVSYGNVARHSAMAHYRDINTSFPLYASSFLNSHLGMGFHVGMAWTVLFNLLGAFKEACTDAFLANDGSGEEASLSSSSSQFDEPSIKYQGPINSMNKVAKQWREAIKQKNETCLGSNDRDRSETPAASPIRAPYSNQVCTYAWIVNRENIRTPQDVTDALEPALVRSSGWEAKNYSTATEMRAPGFGTDNVPNASFELLVRNVTLPTRFLTVYNMKSYGPAFVGSKLALTARVERQQTAQKSNSPENLQQVQDPPPGKNRSTLRREEEEDDGEVEARYEILGYHDLKTSVFFPHKFRLPGGGANAGDSILVRAQLVSGKSFKISGLAFCRN
jgi:hypothetical protein